MKAMSTVVSLVDLAQMEDRAQLMNSVCEIVTVTSTAPILVAEVCVHLHTMASKMLTRHASTAVGTAERYIRALARLAKLA